MTDGVPEDKKEFILALLRHVGTIHGRTRFQKMVFLGQEELKLRSTFNFSAHYYGPYSRDLTETIDQMVAMGYLIENEEDLGDSTRYTYTLSDDGKTISDRLSDDIIDQIAHDTLTKLAKIPLGSILDYVYKKYLPGRCRPG